MVGHKVDLSYSYNHLGETTQVLQEIADGTHPFCKVTLLNNVGVYWDLRFKFLLSMTSSEVDS